MLLAASRAAREAAVLVLSRKLQCCSPTAACCNMLQHQAWPDVIQLTLAAVAKLLTAIC